MQDAFEGFDDGEQSTVAAFDHNYKQPLCGSPMTGRLLMCLVLTRVKCASH